jgi:hypothetical protein
MTLTTSFKKIGFICREWSFNLDSYLYLKAEMKAGKVYDSNYDS